MPVRASDRVTLTVLPAPSYVRQYYVLQSSTLDPPAAPTTNPPVAPWTTVEPTYTEGSTSTLYTVMLTAYGSVAFEYGPVQKSSSYEAAKTALNKAVAAITVANLAEQAAADLIRASQTDPGHVPGRIWIILDAQGRTIGIRQSVDGVWSSYALMADQVLVPGSAGTTSIKDGAITTPKILAGAVDATKITASESLWAKIGVFAEITTQMLLAGGATITGTMLANVIQLASRLVAGDPGGNRTELDATGMHVWKNGVEWARLSAEGNGLQIYNPSMGRLVNLSASAFGMAVIDFPQRVDIPLPTTASAALEWRPGAWVIKTIGQWTATTNRAQGLSTTSIGDSATARDFGVRCLFRLKNTKTGELIDFTDSGNDWASAIRSTGPNLSFNIVPVTPGDTYDVILQAQAIKYISAQGKPWIKNTRITLTPV